MTSCNQSFVFKSLAMKSHLIAQIRYFLSQTISRACGVEVLCPQKIRATKNLLPGYFFLALVNLHQSHIEDRSFFPHLISASIQLEMTEGH